MEIVIIYSFVSKLYYSISFAENKRRHFEEWKRSCCFFVFNRKKKVVQVWNDVEIKCKWWQNDFHNVPLRESQLDLLRRNLRQMKLPFQYHSVDLVKSFTLGYRSRPLDNKKLIELKRHVMSYTLLLCP